MKKIILALLSVLILGILLTACASGTKLNNTSWHLTTLDDQPVLAGAEVTLHL
jgi:hypothetical protein